MLRYNFKLKPFAHQLEALERSHDREEYALFCEMGTGKSKILIDTMSMLYDRGEIEAALIVAPKGVYKNWEQNELPVHLPDHIVHKTTVWSPSMSATNLSKLNESLKKSDCLQILVMNIEAFSTDKGTDFAVKFAKNHRILMAVDESTTIKSRTAKRTKNVIKVGKLAKYRRIMTGSPITQSPLDLYSQCEFLHADLLGFTSFWTFQNRYAMMVKRSVGTHSFNKITGYQNLSELGEVLEKFSYRVRKEDCLDLPEKVYTKRVVELTDEQAKIYGQLKRQALADLENGTVTAQHILTQLLRLQQVCSGFVRLDDGTMQEFPARKLDELMETLEEVSGKVIIWANFTYDILRIEAELAKVYGRDSVRSYYGATEVEDRQQMVRDFQNPNHPLRFFVGQPRTGGYGLTLTAANTVVYFSNGYDLEVRLQSEDRAHRIGQKSSVTYVDIVVENTVDEKILRALRSKINIATQVLAEGYKEWLI
jgi:SNF2 family DNA or RNA helicase